MPGRIVVLLAAVGLLAGCGKKIRASAEIGADAAPTPAPVQQRLTLELVGVDLKDASLGIDVNGVGMIDARGRAAAAQAQASTGSVSFEEVTGSVDVGQPQYREVLGEAAPAPASPNKLAESCARLRRQAVAGDGGARLLLARSCGGGR